MKVKFTPAGTVQVNGATIITKRRVTLQVTSQELMDALQRTHSSVEINEHKPHVIYRLEIN